MVLAGFPLWAPASSPPLGQSPTIGVPPAGCMKLSTTPSCPTMVKSKTTGSRKQASVHLYYSDCELCGKEGYGHPNSGSLDELNFAPCAQRIEYLNNFLRTWSAGQDVDMVPSGMSGITITPGGLWMKGSTKQHQYPHRTHSVCTPRQVCPHVLQYVCTMYCTMHLGGLNSPPFGPLGSAAFSVAFLTGM